MVEIKHIGKSADDLRFFILLNGQHAGGITVHSVDFPRFSYGIAVAPAMRRKGAARAALSLLFVQMRLRGFTQAIVQIAPDNTASLALHAALGFAKTRQDASCITLERTLDEAHSGNM